MTRFVIDPAALLELAVRARAIDRAHQLVAPSSVRSLAMDLLLERVREGQLTDRAALDLHERITTQKIRVLGDRVSRATAWRIARENDWDTIRDAEYFAVTKLQADALVAIDPRLAALAKGIVPLAALSDLHVPE